MQTDSASKPSAVLIIDDEPSVRMLTERLVANFGFKALSAADGSKGIALLQANLPSVAVAVLDLTMPELSGEQTFQALRALDPSLAVIFTSGYEQSELALPDSRTTFLQKPFKRDELREKINNFVPHGIPAPSPSVVPPKGIAAVQPKSPGAAPAASPASGSASLS